MTSENGLERARNRAYCTLGLHAWGPAWAWLRRDRPRRAVATGGGRAPAPPPPRQVRRQDEAQVLGSAPQPPEKMYSAVNGLINNCPCKNLVAFTETVGGLRGPRAHAAAARGRGRHAGGERRKARPTRPSHPMWPKCPFRCGPRAHSTSIRDWHGRVAHMWPTCPFRCGPRAHSASIRDWHGRWTACGPRAHYVFDVAHVPIPLLIGTGTGAWPTD